MSADRKIYHIASAKAWETGMNAGQYFGDTLETEDFIHFSGKDQVIATANRYYHGITGLVLLEVDVNRLAAKLKYEAAPTGEMFPHLYGALNLDAVENVHSFEPGINGDFISLPE